MITLSEQLKEMTTPQLKKLLAIIEHLDQCAADSFDELLAGLTNPKLALSKSDADLIGAECYRLQIYDGFDAATAHKQALQSFESGKLAEPKSPILRHRLRIALAPEGSAATNPGPSLPPTQNNANATLAGASAPTPSKPEPVTLPDNVVLIPTKMNFDCFYSKCFHTPHNENSVW